MVDPSKTLRLVQVSLKHFRCFDQLTLDLNEPVLLIQGVNGAGKTSLLEALHYICYLRSFRTHLSKDLVMFNKDAFFIKATFCETNVQLQTNNNIQVGFTKSKRLVKINQRVVSTYKELIDHYRVVSLTEDDLALIKGNPQARRTFIDQALTLADTTFIAEIRDFRRILENRNRLLQQGLPNQETRQIWTQQLWEKSRTIQRKRQKLLTIFSEEINNLLKKYFNDSFSITFVYKAKNMVDAMDFDQFSQNCQTLYSEEARHGRSLFGAHLDDIIINLQGKKSRSFASRGQQKLILLLIKVAQIKYLSVQKGSTIFLLDDFMADFDLESAKVSISILLGLGNQLIFTSPSQKGAVERQLCSQGARQIFLTY